MNQRNGDESGVVIRQTGTHIRTDGQMYRVVLQQCVEAAKEERERKSAALCDVTRGLKLLHSRSHDYRCSWNQEFTKLVSQISQKVPLHSAGVFIQIHYTKSFSGPSRFNQSYNRF